MKKLYQLGILICCASFSTFAQAQTPPTNGLVAYYPFYGSAASGFGSGGTVNGDPITLTTNFFGASNAAIHFDGNTFLSISPTPFQVNSNWTVSFWLAIDSGANSPNNMLSTGHDTEGGLNIRWVGPDWQVVAGLYYGEGGEFGVTADATNSPYAWNFVTSVKNGSNYSIYLNNTLIGSNSSTGTVTDTGSMWFGQHQVFSYYGLSGSMSDVYIYDRALSTNEVQQLYQSQIAGGAPIILVQPQSSTVNANASASLIAGATGLQPLSYQWSLNGTNLIGATSAELDFANVTQTNLGAYSVTISNALGSITSSNANVVMYPTIVVPFTGGPVYTGGPGTLSVQAWGTGPLAYQWYDNGVALSGATNSTYTIANPGYTDSGAYTVVVSSPFGSVTNATQQVVVEFAGVSLALYPGVSVTGVVGNSYVIQSTTNLNAPNSWTNAATVTLQVPTQLWVDTNGNTLSAVQKFYRVLPTE